MARRGPSEAVEAAAVAADELAQEFGPQDAGRPLTVSPGFVHGVHPKTGIAVVFVPGEALPDWAVARLGGASYDPDAEVIHLAAS